MGPYSVLLLFFLFKTLPEAKYAWSSWYLTFSLQERKTLKFNLKKFACFWFLSVRFSVSSAILMSNLFYPWMNLFSLDTVKNKCYVFFEFVKIYH